VSQNKARRNWRAISPANIHRESENTRNEDALHQILTDVYKFFLSEYATGMNKDPPQSTSIASIASRYVPLMVANWRTIVLKNELARELTYE